MQFLVRQTLRVSLVCCLMLLGLIDHGHALNQTQTDGLQPRVYIVSASNMNSEPRTRPPAQVSFETRVIELINAERARVGLAALNTDARLTAAARAHSQDMADQSFFSHTGSNGSNPGQRITAAGYTWRSYAENIAAGYTSPEEVMRGWMNSPGHRANILANDLRDVGVGYVTQPGTQWTHYWTTNFGSNLAS